MNGRDWLTTPLFLPRERVIDVAGKVARPTPARIIHVSLIRAAYNTKERMMLKTDICKLAVFALIFLLSGCGTNPVTHKRELQ
ncbi:MAG: hypothetical protein Q7T21_09575 [Gallionella sp.]|nr:hypothetical protein [Gallionella sp.]